MIVTLFFQKPVKTITDERLASALLRLLKGSDIVIHDPFALGSKDFAKWLMLAAKTGRSVEPYYRSPEV